MKSVGEEVFEIETSDGGELGGRKGTGVGVFVGRKKIGP
jgi:hypothetical protein